MFIVDIFPLLCLICLTAGGVMFGVTMFRCHVSHVYRQVVVCLVLLCLRVIFHMFVGRW